MHQQPITEHVRVAAEDSSFQTVVNITRRRSGTTHTCHNLFTYLLKSYEKLSTGIKLL